MPKLNNVNSPKEAVVSDGVIAGRMYVHADTGVVVVAPITQSAAAFAASIGASAVKAIDYPARVGAYPDSGLNLFETLG
jgi:hypothetical protein